LIICYDAKEIVVEECACVSFIGTVCKMKVSAFD